MASAAVNPGPSRPVLISRHSSCLPLIHTRPIGKGGSRRCRSASPPVKKKTNSARCTVNPAEQLKSSIDEICLSLRQDGDSKASAVFRIPSEIPRLLHRQPIIKHVTSSYYVKQPRPSRASHTSAFTAQVLPDKSNPILGPADLNGNMIRSNSYCLPGDINKSRRTEYAHYVALSTDSYRQCECEYYNSEPLRKRKSSYSISSLQSTRLAASSAKGMNELPVEIKLKIFSYITYMEKGGCMLVCREWYNILKEPVLWRHIDLRQFSLCYGHAEDELADVDITLSKENLTLTHRERDDLCVSSGDNYGPKEVRSVKKVLSSCTQACYSRYINRVEGFISFLIDIKPRIRSLAFSFDLISDNWLATVHKLLLHLDLSELKYADINWRDTPVKPHYLDRNMGLAMNDFLSKARRRQRYFLEFLDLLFHEAANLETLVTPFVWFDRSVKRLTSFKKLKNLSLGKYFIFNPLNQSELDILLGGMKKLEKLLIEAWSTNNEAAEYSIGSQSLRYLDLSQCRSFYLSELKAPALDVLVVAKHYVAGLTPTSSCLADMIQIGAPNLRRLNNIIIRSAKDLKTNSEVAELLCMVCRCCKHRF